MRTSLRVFAAIPLFGFALFMSPRQETFAFQPSEAGGAFQNLDRDEMLSQRTARMREMIAEFAPKILESDKNPSTQAILKKLDEPLTLAFAQETPFEEVLKFIRSSTQGTKETGLPIYVDISALNDLGIEPSAAVKIDLEGVPLKTTLRLILKQIGLAYCVKDGLIFISSPQGVIDELREFETANLPADKRYLTLPENQLPPLPAAPAKPQGGGFQ